MRGRAVLSPGSGATRRQAFVAFALGASTIGEARSAETDRYVLPFTELTSFRSQSNGVEYTLYVRLPVGYAEQKERSYPVICTLDADYSFAIAANHLEHLAVRNNQAPHAILVSIAYTGAYPDRDRYRRERTRDYTPLFFPEGGYGPEYQTQSGGGPAFLHCIAEEIMPLINGHYRALADDWTLVGHSYGGLFATWVLQSRPDLYARYLIVSPSLWYSNRIMIERERTGEFAPPTRDQYAYFAIGSWEEQPERGQFMVSEMREFTRLLEARTRGRIRLKSRVFEDETHASIFPAAFSTGIRHLFGTM